MHNLMNNESVQTMSSLDFLNNIINPARIVAGESEVRNRDFIKRVADELDLDLERAKVSLVNGNEVKSFELDQDQLLLVGMRESKKVRKSVLVTVKQLTKPVVELPQSFSEALQLAADQAKQLELAAPKVYFVDNLVNRDNLMTATQIGEKHRMSARVLNKHLDSFGVYNKSVKRSRVFNIWFIDKGLGELKKTDSGYDQAMFTNAGEVWINDKLISEGVING